MKILALCGSLRASSFNAAVLRTVQELADPSWEWVVESGIGRLPFFNADDEMYDLPPEVAQLRARVGDCDGIFIATPEYAHGTSGVLKNALEWMVGGGEIAAKPVALASASTAPTGGDNARAWLTQTLTVMGANVLPHDVRIPMAARKVAGGRLIDEASIEALRRLLVTLDEAAAEAARDAA